MYREFFSAMTSHALPLAAMAFFVLAFVLVLARVFVLRRRSDYDSVAALPLDDSDSPLPREVRP